MAVGSAHSGPCGRRSGPVARKIDLQRPPAPSDGRTGKISVEQSCSARRALSNEPGCASFGQVAAKLRQFEVRSRHREPRMTRFSGRQRTKTQYHPNRRTQDGRTGKISVHRSCSPRKMSDQVAKAVSIPLDAATLEPRERFSTRSFGPGVSGRPKLKEPQSSKVARLAEPVPTSAVSRQTDS